MTPEQILALAQQNRNQAIVENFHNQLLIAVIPALINALALVTAVVIVIVYLRDKNLQR